MDHAPSRAASRFLAGRARELAIIEEHLAACAPDPVVGVLAPHGQARRVLLFAGEPGIGKTRLLEATAERADAMGFLVAWGSAAEIGAAPPYWPWIEVLRALFRSGALHDLPVASALRSLFSELDDAPAPSNGGERVLAPFRVHDVIASALHALARAQPLLIVLDDLHAADRSTLDVTDLVAASLRSARVLIAASYRDVEARRVPETEATLARLARRGTLIELPRLDLAAVDTLTHAVLARADSEMTRLIHEATDGNPLFVRELLQLVATKGRASGVPSAAKVVIRERLALLSPATVALLQGGAILGRHFDAHVLAEVAGVAPDMLREALDEARAADIVAADVTTDRWSFSHALIAESLAGDIAASVRARLHRRAAEALERRSVGASATELGAIARHWRLAGHEHAARAAATSARAGLAASSRLAFADAAMAYGDALDAATIAAPEDARGRVELLVLQTEAWVRAGDRGRAAATQAVAGELARALGDRELEARAALAFGAEVVVGFVDPALVRALQAALSAYPECDDPWRARLMARLAAAEQPALDFERPMVAAREALAMARRLGDEGVLADVLFSVGGALCDFAPPDERSEVDDACQRVMLARGDVPRALRALQRLAFDRVDLGDVRGFEAAVAAYRDIAERSGVARLRAVPRLLMAMQAGWEGRFEDEARLLDECFALRAETAEPGVDEARRMRTVMAASLRHGQRVREAGELYLSTLAPGSEALAPLVRAWVALLEGDEPAARIELGVLFWSGVLHGATLDIHFLETCAEVAWRLSDRELARLTYDRLQRYAGRPFVVTGLASLLTGIVDHALMRMAIVLGASDDARRWAASALAFCDRLAARPYREAVLRDAGHISVTAAWRQGLELRRDGDIWTLVFAAETCRVKDSRGMQMLARLVAEPGRDFHVLDLSGATGGEVDLGDAGPVLDEKARRAYRERLASLRADLAEAEGWNDDARREAIESELERVQAELASAYGLGGRERKVGVASERARVNVRRRLADALRRVAEVSSALGDHLEKSVRTGTYCRYEPSV